MLVPLSVGTLVLFFLYKLWHSTERFAEQERYQAKIVNYINDTVKSWGLVTSSRFGATVQKDLGYEQTVKEMAPGLWFRFYELKRLCASEPKKLAAVSRLEELFHQEFDAVSTLPRSSGGLELSTIMLLPKTLGKIYLYRTETRQILNKEWDDLKKLREKQRQSRDMLKTVAYLCTAGNILLALLLVWSFSRTISNRMKVLIRNAGALPRAELPTQHLTGDDELHYLDTVLSSTALQLQEAASHRRAILGMVAHDMRSPLMAAQSSIEMVEELGGNFVEEAFICLEKARDNLSGILQYVQQLLTTQKQQSEQPEQGNDETGASGQSDSTDSENAAPVLSEQSVDQAAPAVLKLPAGRSGIGGLIEAISRPKILHQGLLLVMGPLVLQTAYLLFVNQQLLASEKIAEGEQRCADINIVSTLITVDMVRGATVDGVYLISKSASAQKLAKKCFAEVMEGYDNLEALGKQKKDWLDYTKLARDAASHQVERFLEMTPEGNPDEVFASFTDLSELKSKSPEAFQARQIGAKLLSENEAELSKMIDRQERLAATLNEAFGWSVAANFVLALLMLYFFSSKTTRRLNVLMKNAALIGGRGALQRPLSGSDEIAYLDLILHQAKAQLEQASSQRAEMMISLANDMREPLRNAQLELQSFGSLTEKVLSESSNKHLLRSQGSMERVLKLVNDLLSMESLQTGSVDLEISACSVRSLVDDAISTISSLARQKNIQLLNSCAENSIEADKARLIQVLINFVSNAIKFSGNDTTVTVKSEQRGESVRICVQDEGPGMDKETCARVFEKFFQANTEQKKQGFGLGLAICQLLVQAHGGSLGVESEPGVGSCFWFEIPVKQAAG